MDTGIAHGYEQHLGRDVHIAREGQHEHEYTEGNRVRPPSRQHLEVNKVLADNLNNKPVKWFGQERAAADMRRKGLRHESQGEDSP